jgi:hypothetical protein
MVGMVSPICVWIRVEGNVNDKYHPSLTTRREEATVLSAADSQQVARAASDTHKAYSWLSIPVVGKGRYVVEGMPRTEASISIEAA